MVKLTPPPETIRDGAVYDYLYQMQEYLTLELARIEETPAAARRAEAVENKAIQEQYQTLKAFILKTAETVESKTQADLSGLRAMADSLGELVCGEDGLQATLATVQRDYVARSDFGTYSEQVSARFAASAETLTQQIARVEAVEANTAQVGADFQSYRVETEGYIRSGIVYYENGLPVIGIAIGQNLRASGTATVDGQTFNVIAQEGFRAIYGAREMSFWQGDVKVAYMSNNRLYITDVTALATLTIGQWRFSTGNGLAIQWMGA